MTTDELGRFKDGELTVVEVFSEKHYRRFSSQVAVGYPQPSYPTPMLQLTDAIIACNAACKAN